MAKNKKPKSVNIPESKKKPRSPRGPKPGQPIWSFRNIDVGGPWCWTETPKDILCEVLIKLGNYQSMSWAEIDDTAGGQKTGSHFVPIDKIIKKAQNRLIDIHQDDNDELFSLRITGKCRMWGIRDGDVFHFLWCDPEHAICPSSKRYT